MSTDVVVRLPLPRRAQSVQGTLALDLTPRLDPPAPVVVPGRPHDLVDLCPATRAKVDQFATAYLQAAIEVSIGDRPAAQLLRHTSPRVHEDLSRRAVMVARAAGTDAARGRGPSTVRPVVVSTRTSLVTDEALEASAHVRYGQRSRAVAARFEARRGRWQCVALEFA